METNSRRLVRFSSVAIVACTILTFGLALWAVPVSGANAPGGGIHYPYLETLGQFPRDFFWQMSALIQIIAFVFWVKTICNASDAKANLLMNLTSVFAVMASIILLANYYIQISVIPVSLKNGELEGLPLLIQYNSHGVFIALEELGYWMMLGAITMLAFHIEEYKAVKILGIAAAVIVVSVFIFLTVKFGIDRKDRFETIIISVDWIMLIVLGIAYSRPRRESRKVNS